MNVAARDVREGGSWTLTQRIKNDALYMLATGVLAVADRLPASFLRVLGRMIGALAWVFLGGRAVRNIARALPEADAPSLVRRNFRHLGELLGDTVAGLNARRAAAPLPFLPGARACLDAAIAEGTGVVFASAHLGPWERVASSLASAGVPLTVVAREPYDPRLAPVYARLRRGVRAVYRGHGGAGIALVRVLRRGGVLAIPMDLATRATSVTVPFLGIPARTPVGPARLAIRTGAVVVVGTASPEGIFVERIVSSSDETELTARINEALSARIRAWPEAWLWMHHRWD